MNNKEKFYRIAYWTSMYEDDAAAIILNRIAFIEANRNFHHVSKTDKGNILFVFCTEGKGTICLNDKRIGFAKGNAFIADTSDGYEVFSESDVFRFCYILTSGIFVSQLFGHQLKDRGHFMPYSAETLSILENVYDLAKKGWSYENEIRISCLLYDMCGEMLIANTHDSTLEPVVQYMHEHYSEDISMTDLSKLCFLGSSQFIKRFKECYSKSPKSYLTNIRIDKAKYYLLKSNDSITEIAARVGFEDSSYFTRVFRQHVGKTPKEYRKNIF